MRPNLKKFSLPSVHMLVFINYFACVTTTSARDLPDMQPLAPFEESADEQMADPDPVFSFKRYVYRLAKKSVAFTAEQRNVSDYEIKLNFNVIRLLEQPERVRKAWRNYFPEAPTYALDANPQSFCSVNSPWAQINVDVSPSVRVEALFTWNDRQILFDQVILTGRPSSRSPDLTPIPTQKFEDLADRYAVSFIEKHTGDVNKQKGIPDDIFWLFRKSFQTTRGPFSFETTSKLDLIRASKWTEYATLALALLDKCLSGKGGHYYYKDILEFNDSNAFSSKIVKIVE